MTLDTVYWNLCPGETPGQVYNVTFAVDTANITVGANGMYLGGGVFGNAQGYNYLMMMEMEFGLDQLIYLKEQLETIFS